MRECAFKKDKYASPPTVCPPWAAVGTGCHFWLLPVGQWVHGGLYDHREGDRADLIT